MNEQALPAAFFGHGNPMNALDHNRFTEAWRTFGAGVSRPRAVLMVSAHWYTNLTAVTAMSRPKTIHDFYGFPDELFAVEYPAPGDPELAGEVAEIAKPTHVALDDNIWGLDHGTWSVLAHVFPEADVPVVQLSINAQKPFDYHVDLGAQIAPLRERGVLVACSGNVVHNLRRTDWSRPEAAFDWARRFDEAVRELMTTRPDEIQRLQEHDDYALAVPTPDHFIPLLYLAGVAAASRRPAEPLVEGYAMGSLSMTAYTVGSRVAAGSTEANGAPPLPDVPADETNI
jgi:4,5-DOPA dioxygenase extradiol